MSSEISQLKGITPYHVIFGIHDDNGSYVPQLAVAITSVMENTNSSLMIHVLTDQRFKKEFREKLKELVRAYQNEIIFHDVNISFDKDLLVAMEYLSIGTLYRLYITELLDNVDKALYLDCDVIVRVDIKELFELDIDGKAIAAVIDSGIKNNSWIFTKGIPVKKRKYFNAGVILFNLNKLRCSYNMLNGAMGFLKKYPKCFGGDQAPLNYLFQDDCVFISEKYNRFPTKENDDIEAKCIWHFAGGKGNKPWITRAFIVSDLYWLYLYKTPWGKDKEWMDKMKGNIVIPLEDALINYPIGSRRAFLKSMFRRLRQEWKLYRKMF